jgi:predicted ATPase/transcriptional regulator with XRE-family HTH domain
MSSAGAFAVVLRGLRERAGLTQEELAELAGLTPHAISSLERGVRTRPYPHTVRSLADALGLDDADRTALIAAVPSRGSSGSPGASPSGRAAATASDAYAGPPSGADSLQPQALPVPLTTLVGRDEEVATVADLLTGGEARLVTLTGMGGVGKTRLSLAAAEAVRDHFRDGVAWVPLAALAEPDLVVPTIGRAVGLAHVEGLDTSDAVAAGLRDRHLLLVLDNLEQLVSAGARIAGLLQASPGLVVLASSRAPLRVRGEHELPVHPLALPAAGEHATPEDLQISPAATLFVTRAQSVRPAFEVTPANAEAVAELCTRLDGIPLALELAAAKARALEPAELLRRLGDVLDRGAAADLPERQQTMTATLDWSYDLLGPAEQTLLRRLGTFVDGFDLEAAAAVATSGADGADGAPPADVVDTLGRLVEHSLVLYRPLPDGTARYRLLEPVRQYALAKLDEDELRETSLRHARHFLARAQRDIPAYRGAGAVDALAATALDDGNHEAALERSVRYGEGELAARLCFALWLYWWLRGTLITGRRHAEQALALPLSDATRIEALLTRSAMTFAQGDLAASMPGWQEVREIGLRIGDRHAQAHGTAGEALVAIARGDLDHAETLLTRATALSSDGLDDELWLWSLVNIWLGTVRLLRGHADEAGVLVRRGIDAARARGDRLVTYIGLFTASQAAAALGNGAAAREHLEEGIRLSTQTRDLANLAYFVEALAVLEGADVGAPGHARRVAVLLGTAEALRDRVGARVYGYYQPDESLRDRVEHQVRSLLGPEAFADAVAEGRGLDADESAALALTRGQRLRLAGS